MIVLIRTLTSRTFQLFNNLNTKLNYPVMFFKNFSCSLGVLKTIKIPSQIWLMLDPIQYTRTCRHGQACVPHPLVFSQDLWWSPLFSLHTAPEVGVTLGRSLTRWRGGGWFSDAGENLRTDYGNYGRVLMEDLLCSKGFHNWKTSSFGVEEVGSLYQRLGIPTLPPSGYLPLHFFLSGFPSLLLSLRFHHPCPFLLSSPVFSAPHLFLCPEHRVCLRLFPGPQNPLISEEMWLDFFCLVIWVPFFHTS